MLKNININAKHKPGRSRGIFWLTLFVIVALSLPGFIRGWGRHQHGPYMRRGISASSPSEMLENISKRTNRILEHVDATEAQQEQVKSILQQMEPDLENFQKERQALREDFADTLEAEQIDPQQLAEMQKATVHLVEQVTDRSLTAMREILQVLTPEQRKELVAMWKKRN